MLCILCICASFATTSALATVPAVRPAVARAPMARMVATELPTDLGERATMDDNVFKLNKFIIDTVKGAIDVIYANNDFARFYVLETVARVPYFAYLSVMHLRETFGKREPGDSQRMRTHYAEADNEYHHLLIMEELGGNASAIDRTLAQTMAFFYYWYVIGVYTVSEQTAYHLSELIEDHAFMTYDKFIARKGDELKTMPVPSIAKQYYQEDNPYMFDTFCTVKDPGCEGIDLFSKKRNELNSLYDVFVNVRDDEKEHWKTLCNLVQFDDMQGVGPDQIEGTKPTPVDALAPY